MGRVSVRRGAYVRSGFTRWRRLWRQDRLTRAFTALLIGVSAAIVATAFTWHTLAYTGVTAQRLPSWLIPWNDGTLLERWEAAVSVTAIIGLLTVWIRRRQAVYGVWALILAFIIVDNAFRVHESVGHALATTLNPYGFGPFEGRHLGELVCYAAAGLAAMASLAVTLRRADKLAREDSAVQAVWLAALVVCATVIDAAHAATKSHLIAFVEDGGEALALAAIAAHAVALARSRVQTPEPQRL